MQTSITVEQYFGGIAPSKRVGTEDRSPMKGGFKTGVHSKKV
jgi:hypothetical protein